MELIQTPKPTDGFKVKLEVFEGPFDLLLHLVEEQKVAVYDISISQITAAYLEYLHHLQKLDLDISGEFMVLAALLIEMKSKMLLPADNPDNEALLAEAEAERKALLERLVEYKAFKNLAKGLAEKEYQNLHVHTREHINEELWHEYPGEKKINLKNVALPDLLNAFNKVWQDFELRVLTKDINPFSNKIVSIRDKMHDIVEILKKAYTKLTFSDLFKEAVNRFEIIATFIALLELVRQQFILIVQSDLFDEIEIIARKNIHEKEIVLDEKEYNQVQGVSAE
jgi:segregation and condensation protein A